MSKHKPAMQLRKAVTIAAPLDTVFASFFKAIKECSIPAPEVADNEAAQLALEGRLGGALYADWEPGEVDSQHRIILGTITALSEPNLVRIVGPFAFDGRCGYSVVSLEIEPLSSIAKVTLSHDAMGDVDDETRDRWASTWQALLEQLKLISESGKKSHDRAYRETLANRAMQLLSDVDREMRQDNGLSWQPVVQRLSTLGEGTSLVPKPKVVMPPADGAQHQLQQLYQDLQTNLIQIRQATAQAIAVEKLLEQQLQKNKDQAETWLNRAKSAAAQGNPDLEDQAKQRMAQYVQSVAELEEQLSKQRKETANLRQRLTDAEAHVQKAYTQKQVLITREKAAHATRVANELLSQLDTDATLSALAQYEKKVVELEQSVETRAESQGKQMVLSPRMDFADAIAALQKAIDAISRLEQMTAKLEQLKKSDAG